MKKILLLLLVFPLVVAAQQDDNSVKDRQQVEKYPTVKWRKKKKIAKNLAKEGSYYNAVSYYEDVLKAKPDDKKTIYQLAELNRSLRDYKQAEKYYTLLLDKDKEGYPTELFYLGQMQKMNGKYDEARATFKSYLKTNLPKKEKSFKSLAKVEIEGIDSSAAWLANPNKIKVEYISGDVINTTLTDASPKPLSGNRLLYSSLKSDTAIIVTNNKRDYYSKIFLATKAGNGWNEEMYPFPPNDSKMHVANAILTDDEKTMYFTKCSDNPLVKTLCKLYKTEKQGAEWDTPTELKTLNTVDGSYTTTQPALGLDKDGNKILYFVSDRAGKGGLDIFYAELKDDGSFGAVKNAGSEVNTPGDEYTPFYDSKFKALYFSSNGRPSLGGMDVFKIEGTPENWGVATNLGAPLNSSADDFYFALDEKGKKGYVVSNRVGTKTVRGETDGDDIWSVGFKDEIVLKGIFADRADLTKTPLVGVDGSVYRVEGKSFEFVGQSVTTNDPFYYVVKNNTSYKINGNKEGYWPSVETFKVAENEERDTIYQVFLMDKIIKKYIMVENIYFAFDKSNVLDFYKLKMDSVVSILNLNPGYNVEVQGHTDSKGSDEYNQKLSERRANEAKAYIVSKGINEARVIAKGYGETMPLAPNEIDGQDNPEGRNKNRRVEFKIVPDKPADAPEIKVVPGDPIQETKTGPGYGK